MTDTTKLAEAMRDLAGCDCWRDDFNQHFESEYEAFACFVLTNVLRLLKGGRNLSLPSMVRCMEWDGAQWLDAWQVYLYRHLPLEARKKARTTPRAGIGGFTRGA